MPLPRVNSGRCRVGVGPLIRKLLPAMEAKEWGHLLVGSGRLKLKFDPRRQRFKPNPLVSQLLGREDH